MNAQLSNRLSQGNIDPETLYKVVSNCLQVVFIDLDQRERPYEIFESLNAKSKPLTQADLVRNYIAMRLPEERQAEVFEQHWSRIEDLLQERRTVGRSRLGELTAFLRHYLAMRSGTLCNEEHVYARFRDRIEHEFATPDEFITELVTLKRYARHYDRLLRPENEPNLTLRAALTRLNVLEIATGYPFLLAAYDAFQQGDLSEEGFLEGLMALENYLVRRYLAGEPYNYLNKMFPTLWRDVETAQFGSTLRRALVTRNYPSNPRIRHAVEAQELYDRQSSTQKKICLILESINRHLSAGSGGYTQLDTAPTIEHIMPQTTSAEWQQELGPDWRQTHEDYLHTLGNLTLVTQEWNATLSNAPFTIKKGRLAVHALRLNSDYFSAEIPHWGETTIKARAGFLAEHVLDIWSAFEETMTAQPIAHGRPRAVTVLGDVHATQSWRDVAFHTAECIAQVADDFNSIAQRMPAYLSHNQFAYASRQLSNGWWINLNLSAENIRRLCRRLLQAAGISEDEWQVDVSEE